MKSNNLIKSKLKDKVCFLSTVKRYGEKSRQQDLEAGPTRTVKKSTVENLSTGQFPFSMHIQPKIPPRKWTHAHNRHVLLLQLVIIKVISFRHAQGPISQVTLASVKMVMLMVARSAYSYAVC